MVPTSCPHHARPLHTHHAHAHLGLSRVSPGLVPGEVWVICGPVMDIMIKHQSVEICQTEKIAEVANSNG